MHTTHCVMPITSGSERCVNIRTATISSINKRKADIETVAIVTSDGASNSHIRCNCSRKKNKQKTPSKHQGGLLNLRSPLQYTCISSYFLSVLHFFPSSFSLYSHPPSVCDSLTLSGCLSVCLSVCLSLSLSPSLSLSLAFPASHSLFSLSLYLSLSLSPSLFISLSLSISLYLSLSPPLTLS